jgi:DNA-binding LacI/PurR family transcriptional regulator
MPSLRSPATPASPAHSIKQVAAAAGVSVATVSRVLNGSSAVVDETRRKVQATIVSMGYQPNAMARNLRAASSGLLLVTVPDLRNPFYGQVVQGLARRMQQHGYHMLLVETGHEALDSPNHLTLIQRRLVDGAICLDAATVQRAIAQRLHELPWVALAEYDAELKVPFVGIDNTAAAVDAVSHLVQRGRRRIAFVGHDERFMYARQRLEGYRRALVAGGLVPDAALVVASAGLDYDDGAAAIATLLHRPREQWPDAVFAVSDTLAIGALRQARALGLRVPADLAVVGFDDVDLAAHSEPALSTIRQPMRQMGEQAAQVLVDRLRGRTTATANARFVLRHELVVRHSS